MRKSTVSLTDSCESFLSHKDFLSISSSNGGDALFTLLDTLTQKQREIVYLYLIDRLSTNEIASELSISPQAVYSRAHNAFKRLQENSEYINR